MSLRSLALLCFLLLAVLVPCCQSVKNLRRKGPKETHTHKEEAASCPEQKYTVPPVQDYLDALQQATADDPFVAQMASITNRINNLLEEVSGWKLEKWWDVGATESKCSYIENVGIYRRSADVVDIDDIGTDAAENKSACVLAFSSMDGGRWQDWKTNFFKSGKVSWCGFEGVHAGYVERASHFMDANSSKFPGFSGYIQKHCSKLVLTGHSMGGAIATLVASCASKQPLLAWPPLALYTFGAPAVAKPQLNTSIFEGYRIYSKDNAVRDPIPPLSRMGWDNFEHPKLKPFKIKESGFSGHLSFKLREAGSVAAKGVPEYGPIYKPWLLSDTVGFVNLHSAKTYVARLLKMCGKQPKRTEKKDAVPDLPSGFCDPNVPS